MIEQEKKPRNRSEQMIMNNFITMKRIVQHKNGDLTLEKLLEVHQLISSNTLDDPGDEGKLRSNDEVYAVNHSNSEIVHTPPKESELQVLIKDLCTFFDTNNENFIHPIVKG